MLKSLCFCGGNCMVCLWGFKSNNHPRLANFAFLSPLCHVDNWLRAEVAAESRRRQKSTEQQRSNKISSQIRIRKLIVSNRRHRSFIPCERQFNRFTVRLHVELYPAWQNDYIKRIIWKWFYQHSINTLASTTFDELQACS